DAAKIPGAVAGQHLEQLQAAARATVREGADLDDDGGGFALDQGMNRKQAAAVLVAEGEGEDEIFDGEDALGSKHFRPARPNSFQILNFGAEAQSTGSWNAVGRHALFIIDGALEPPEAEVCRCFVAAGRGGGGFDDALGEAADGRGAEGIAAWPVGCGVSAGREGGSAIADP